MRKSIFLSILMFLISIVYFPSFASDYTKTVVQETKTPEFIQYMFPIPESSESILFYSLNQETSFYFKKGNIKSKVYQGHIDRVNQYMSLDKQRYIFPFQYKNGDYYIYDNGTIYGPYNGNFFEPFSIRISSDGKNMSFSLNESGVKKYFLNGKKINNEAKSEMKIIQEMQDTKNMLILGMNPNYITKKNTSYDDTIKNFKISNVVFATSQSMDGSHFAYSYSRGGENIVLDGTIIEKNSNCHLLAGAFSGDGKNFYYGCFVMDEKKLNLIGMKLMTIKLDATSIITKEKTKVIRKIIPRNKKQSITNSTIQLIPSPFINTLDANGNYIAPKRP